MWCQIVVAETAKISMEISILNVLYVAFEFKVVFKEKIDFEREFFGTGDRIYQFLHSDSC